MSLLSSTQGTPERVWSLVSAITLSGGSLERSLAANWLNPGFTRKGERVSENSNTFNQTLNAATSLGVIQLNGTTVNIAPGCEFKEHESFQDWVHDRLVSLDSAEKDAVVLETYAWIVVQSLSQNGVGWVYDWSRDQFADAADKALPEGEDDDGARRINTTKLAALHRWLSYVGLLVPMPDVLKQAYPSADDRIDRELQRSQLPISQEIEAGVFLDAICARMPYLDRGRIFLATAKRIGYAPHESDLSPLLSTALRNLHDAERIELRAYGDSTGVMRLSRESTHPIQTFQTVMVKSGGQP